MRLLALLPKVICAALLGLIPALDAYCPSDAWSREAARASRIAAQDSKSDVCSFILAQAKERSVDEFIRRGLERAKIGDSEREAISESLETGEDSYQEAYRLFINKKDPKTELLWFRTFVGTADCQRDMYARRSKDGRYVATDQDNDFFAACSEGDCCGGDHSHYSHFQFGNDLYRIDCSGNCDNLDEFTVYRVTEEGFYQACGIRVEAWKMTNIKYHCPDRNVCEAAVTRVKKRLPGLLSDKKDSETDSDEAGISLADREGLSEAICGDVPGRSGDDCQEDFLCSQIDFNNDGLPDMSCVRDFPWRWKGEIRLFVRKNKGEFLEVRTPDRKRFPHERFGGYGREDLFFTANKKTYTIDYALNRSPRVPRIALGIFEIKDSTAISIGRIEGELRREVKQERIPYRKVKLQPEVDPSQPPKRAKKGSVTGVSP
jgi:hypothetical protein